MVIKNKEHLGDLTGRSFCDGKLIAIERVENTKDNHKIWKCRCTVCGKDDILVRSKLLVDGKYGCKCTTHVAIIIDGVKHKRCSKCNNVLTYDKFSKENNKKYDDGLRPACKDCEAQSGIKYREENHDKMKLKYKLENERNKLDGAKIKRDEKWCPTCKEVKSVDAFCISLAEADGLFWRCAKCQNKYAKQYRDANPDKEKSRHQVYGKTDDGKKSARKRKNRRARELGTQPINKPTNISNYEGHHLHLRTKENGTTDKDKTIFIPIELHSSSGMRHYPDGVGRNFRKNMAKITAASFNWLLTDDGLSTLCLHGEEYNTIIELIEEGKKANLDHIPEEHREAHLKGIIALEKFIGMNTPA
jgi:hypothetical protein